MGGMKNILFIVASVFLFVDQTEGRVQASSKLSFYKQAALSMTDCILANGSPVPTKWSQLEMVSSALNSDKNAIEIKRSLDEMAIVPGAPTLTSDAVGGSWLDAGCRLFAISRKSNFDEGEGNKVPSPSSEGRFVILISDDGKSAWATWINEGIAQKILSKILKFELIKIPLEFGDLVNEEDAAKRNEENAALYAKKMTDLHGVAATSSGYASNFLYELLSKWSFWILVLISIFSVFMWRNNKTHSK